MNDWQEAEQRVEKAQEYFHRRQWLSALDELRAAIAINPHNAAWHFNAGLILDELSRFEEAAIAYRRAHSLDPRDVECLNHLGVALHRTGQFVDALDAFSQIQQVDPAFEPSYCNRIITYAHLGQHDAADEMFYLARLYKDECPHCYYNIGRSLYTRGQYAKAIACWTRALDMDGAHPRLHVRIAEASRKLNDLEKARQHYLLAMRSDPADIQTLVDFGELLIDLGRRVEAVEKFHRAIELAPDHPAGHFYLARWHESNGRDEDAAALFVRALQCDANYPGANLFLAEIHLRHDQRDRALRHLRRELSIQCEDPGRIIRLANLLSQTSQHRAAVAALKRLVSEHPHNLSAWQNLAVSEFEAGRFADAVESSRRALHLSPANRAVMHNLIVGCERAGKYSDGLIWAARALTLSPTDTDLHRLAFRLRFLRAMANMRRVVRSAWSHFRH
jgi:tetratricopeptide (TPR) repeat protein